MRQYIGDAPHHPFGIFDYLVVPKPQNRVALFREPMVTKPISSIILGVLSAVELDDESLGQAYEINDVRAQWLLTAKLVPLQPALT